MANSSNAFGEITFINPVLKDLAIFMYYFNKKQSASDYSTYIFELENASFEEILDIVKKDSQKINDKYSITFSFDAFGRWTYENNLSWFFNLDNYKDQIEELTDYDSLIENTLIKVNFLDEERGFKNLIEYSCELSAKKNKYDNYESVKSNIVKNTFDYTAKNLRELFDYEIYSLTDAIENMEYYFNEDAINNHKTEIIESLTSKEDKIFYDFNDFKKYTKINPAYFLE